MTIFDSNRWLSPVLGIPGQAVSETTCRNFGSSAKRPPYLRNGTLSKSFHRVLQSISAHPKGLEKTCSCVRGLEIITWHHSC